MSLCVTEFKEIRKEWKARKKEEEAQRKAAEEEARRRAAEEAQANSTTGAEPQSAVTSAGQYVSGMPPQQRQLPPLSYQPSVSLPNGVQYAATSSAPTASMDSMAQQYGQQQMYSTYPPQAQQFAGQATQPIYAGQQRAQSVQTNGNNSNTNGGEDSNTNNSA